MKVSANAAWTDRAAKATLLIRILVGWVVLSEGIQKFLFPDSLGVGRFVKIGIPSPGVMAPFVGAVEIVCGDNPSHSKSRISMDHTPVEKISFVHGPLNYHICNDAAV